MQAPDDDPDDENQLALPFLPYGSDTNRNSGYSGSDTSAARAYDADTSGATRHRQATTIRLLHAAGRDGLTWKELDIATGWQHHGTTTGALSNLHKAGAIARLTDVRSRCKVYVMPNNVDGRDTEPHGSRGRVESKST